MFSASLPPYLASAAVKAFDILEENPDLITKLRENINILYKGINALLQVPSQMPLIRGGLDFLPLIRNVKKCLTKIPPPPPPKRCSFL